MLFLPGAMQSESGIVADVRPSAEQRHSSRIPELDGLRGVAALAVFCHHVLFTSVVHLEQWPLPVRLIGAICQAGAYGVDLFFVLSGFLITSILLTDRSQPHYYWNFYWRRALRILPLYGVVLLWLATFYPPTRRYVLLSALFLANFEHLFHLSSWGPFWSLAIEEQFYLFWPRVLKNLSLKSVEKVSIAVAASSLGLRLLDTLTGHHNYRFTFFHLDGLALGALLACQLISLRAKKQTNAEVRLLLQVTAVGLVLVVLPSVFDVETRLGMAVEAFRLTGVVLLAYAAVRTAVVFSGAGFLALLRSRVLVFFGLISYALYLLHEYTMNFHRYFLGRLRIGDTLGFFWRFAVVLGVTVLLSLISRYVIEKPAMSLRRYVLRKS